MTPSKPSFESASDCGSSRPTSRRSVDRVGSFGPAHPTEQRVHLGPEPLPLLAFLVRQTGESVPGADAGQGGSALRELGPLPGGKAHLRRALLGLAGPPGEVFAEPVERLPAPAGAFLDVRLFRVLPLSAPRQRCGAGGVVAD